MNAYIAPGILENKKLTEAEVIDLIIGEVCEHFKTTPETVFVGQKNSKLVTVRHIIRWLLRKHTKLTYKRIGEIAHSGRHVRHTTIIDSVCVVNNYLDTNDEFAAHIQNLDALITIKIRK